MTRFSLEVVKVVNYSCGIFLARSALIPFRSKQPPQLFYEKRCFEKYHKIHRKTPAHRCFLMNFVKFLRTPFLQNTSGRLLLLETDAIQQTITVLPSSFIDSIFRTPWLIMSYFCTFVICFTTIFEGEYTTKLRRSCWR